MGMKISKVWIRDLILLGAAAELGAYLVFHFFPESDFLQPFKIWFFDNPDLLKVVTLNSIAIILSFFVYHGERTRRRVYLAALEFRAVGTRVRTQRCIEIKNLYREMIKGEPGYMD
jgi:hypothetical protein